MIPSIPPPAGPDIREKSEQHELEPLCRACGYSLRELGAAGACPECGASFPPFWDESGLLSAGRICWRLSWPLAGVVACFLFVVATANKGADKLAGIGVAGIGLMVLAIFINTPLQVFLLGRRHAPAGRRSGSFVRHLPIGGQVAVWAIIVAIVLPVVVALVAFLGV